MRGRIYANSLETKQTLLSCLFSFFLFHLCLQGEVVEFIDEFLDEDTFPVLEGPPKHWKTISSSITPPSLYLMGFVQGSDWSLCSHLQIHILNILKCPILCTKYHVLRYGHTAQWLKTIMIKETRNIFTHCFMDFFLHCESCMLYFIQWNDNKTSGLSRNNHSVVVILQLLVLGMWAVVNNTPLV